MNQIYVNLHVILWELETILTNVNVQIQQTVNQDYAQAVFVLHNQTQLAAIVPSALIVRPIFVSITNANQLVIIKEYHPFLINVHAHLNPNVPHKVAQVVHVNLLQIH